MIIRDATHNDAAQLSLLLNEIIATGGTTALESPLSPEAFAASYLGGERHISCLVAEGEDGVLLGFQSLQRHSKLPEDCADIATFARQQPKVPGVGRALLSETIKVAVSAGFTQINATIRADNVPGLGYYSRMGFVEHHVDPAIPLNDGTPVDRISKRLNL